MDMNIRSILKLQPGTFLSGGLLIAMALTFIGCPPPPRALPPDPPPADLTAVYSGNHELSATINRPEYRVIAPDTRRGPVHVYETSGGAIRMTLRMYDDGDQCHLNGQRHGAQVTIHPGQRCSIRILYNGSRVFVGMEMNSGTATFAGRRMNMDLSGPIVGDVELNGRRVSISGSGRVRFWGQR